ncbi:ferrous iron transport protein B [Clostridium sp. D2Q-14]|uniref:ferrous iron transport protein B n=1 Tax=Anaeromonas gelatinilytica TaxID=2683194 RepID=UPI00193C3D14|nr:ferrous iron transport protein B [Anaeromonas gelatinilytica]MBS4535074.1 ferrous iron transport protein B [Anaeromonas gelatinilytica]
MNINLALVGNPNSGKTTMFNELTGSSQYVGNWPGVTVEKKQGKLKKHKDISIIDLPGIYSLSPYTLEEVITRDYLIDEKPDVIINIVDASNMERNLYLTTQLVETGIPTVVALNMIDVVNKNGDKIDVAELSKELGCPVIETSAIKGNGIRALASESIELAKSNKENIIKNIFSDKIEDSINEISELIKNDIDDESNKYWYSIKLFEQDEKIIDKLNLSETKQNKIKQIVEKLEEEFDDDAEGIVTTERYNYIEKVIFKCYKKVYREMTNSDKIDSIVTNKWLALPIFFGILWLIYYVSISTVGDWTIGYVEDFFGIIQDGSISVLTNLGASEWTLDLVGNGIIGSIGAIFTFVPQLMILFFFLSLLEDSGYMARVAFIMDRIFRKFGLSGKSFIPMLIGTGCSIPGIMASRTIENEKDRRMTILLTPFIPCGAKLPVFAMFIAMMFSEQTWVGPSIYIISIFTVIISGIFLKKTKFFAGEPAPFVMELPTYKIPRLKGVAIHMWEKAKSFIKKAGTIIFVSSVVIWLLQSFSFSLEYLPPERVSESMLAGIGEAIRWVFVPLGFGDSWAPAVASMTGLIAKEVVVATFASVGNAMPIQFTQVTAFAFMIFTLFAAPCFAAIGAMRREFGNWKLTLFAVGYQTGLAYILALLVNAIGSIIFKGSQVTTSKTLNISAMEEASESAVVNGDIVLIVFGIILLVAIAIGVTNKIRNSKKHIAVSK